VAVILCQNNTGRGRGAALDPSEAWRTPLGDVPLARGMAERLLDLVPLLEEDPEAHRREHSL
jgi:AmmeMemoRadiSam system protein B